MSNPVVLALLALASALGMAVLFWITVGPWMHRECPVAADLAEPVERKSWVGDRRFECAVEIAVLEYLISLHRENFGKPMVFMVEEMEARADVLRKEMGW